MFHDFNVNSILSLHLANKMSLSGETDVVLSMKLSSSVSCDYTVDLSTMKMENEETGK